MFCWVDLILNSDRHILSADSLSCLSQSEVLPLPPLLITSLKTSPRSAQTLFPGAAEDLSDFNSRDEQQLQQRTMRTQLLPVRGKKKHFLQMSVTLKACVGATVATIIYWTHFIRSTSEYRNLWPIFQNTGIPL